MNTLDAIKYRKSVRKYEQKEVEFEKIKAVVEAGNMATCYAVSAKLFFNVISDEANLKRLAEATNDAMRASGRSVKEGQNMLYHAPVAVIISTTPTDSEINLTVAQHNVACAGENMVLAATDLGLGSCYLMSPIMALQDVELKKALKISEELVPTAVIVFGYTSDNTPHRERKSNPENIIYV